MLWEAQAGAEASEEEVLCGGMEKERGRKDRERERGQEAIQDARLMSEGAAVRVDPQPHLLQVMLWGSQTKHLAEPLCAEGENHPTSGIREAKIPHAFAKVRLQEHVLGRELPLGRSMLIKQQRKPL